MSYSSPFLEPELMIRTAGDGQAAFLRKLAAEINEQNSNQHAQTQAAMKTAAREQVGFNLAGYLDDFSKALSVSPLLPCVTDCANDDQGEVRALLKEVGDLRESRRALYMWVLWAGRGSPDTDEQLLMVFQGARRAAFDERAPVCRVSLALPQKKIC